MLPRRRDPQVLQLLAAHLAQWSTSVAAPELAHLPTVQLKALAKALPAERFRSQARPLHPLPYPCAHTSPPTRGCTSCQV